MTLEAFIIAGLATWRISHALLFEDGMFDICTRVRSAIANENSRFFVGLFSCIYCMSFWIGMLTSVIVLSGFTFVLCPFAVSSAAILMNRYAGTRSGSHN